MTSILSKFGRLGTVAGGILFAAFGSVCQAQSATGEAAPDNTSLRIVLAGDSTMCNYPPDRPDRGWGMFLEEQFREGSVKVVNLAAGGRSTKTFLSEGRWQKALEEKPNYLFIQFGHNDSHTPDKPEATDFATDFRENLNRYIDDARAAGATPVLVTPMVRRIFNAEGRISEKQGPGGRNLLAYAKAVSEVGAQRKVAVIDLYSASKSLMEKLGPRAADEFANKPGGATHFNEKGARAMADLVVAELPAAAPKLAVLLKSGEDAGQ